MRADASAEDGERRARGARTAIATRHEEHGKVSPRGFHRRQRDDVADYDDPPPGGLVEEPFAGDVWVRMRSSIRQLYWVGEELTSMARINDRRNGRKDPRWADETQSLSRKKERHVTVRTLPSTM